MSPRTAKLVGTFFITIGVFALMFRVFGGTEFSLLPWPVSLIVIGIGVFFLKLGGGVDGWTENARKGSKPS